jgi:mannosyltransferase
MGEIGTERREVLVVKWTLLRLTAVMVVILLVGWGLRLPHMGADSLWGDEIRSATRASLPEWSTAYEVIRRVNQAPFYEWGVLRWWLKLSGGDRQVANRELLLRYPSVLLGIMAVSAVYIFGRVAFGRSVGVVSAGLLAISPLHVYYSREARTYALVSLLMTLALCCLLTAVRRPANGTRVWGAYGLLATASLYAHYYTGFTLLIANSFVLMWLLLRSDIRLLKQWLAANLLVVLLFVPWLPTFLFQIRQHSHDWLDPTTMSGLLTILPLFFVEAAVVAKPVWWAAALVIWLLLFFGVVAAVRQRHLAPREYRSFLLLAGIVLLTLLSAYLFSLFLGPFIVLRYFIALVAPTVVLVAYSLCQIRRWPVAILTAVFLLTIGLASTYQITTSRWREDWQSVAAYIEANSSGEDVIVIFIPLTFWRTPFDYYYRGDRPVVTMLGEVTDEPAVNHLLTQLPPHRRVWLLQSAQHLDQPGRLTDLTLEFEHHYLAVRHVFSERVALETLFIHLWLLESEL